MKKIILFVCIFSVTITYSQKSKSANMGQATLEELKMKVYDKDSTAIAVVLYEQGNTYINPSRNYYLSTDYYFRIKILKKDGFKKGGIKIPFYRRESVENIKGVTYNMVASSLQKKHLLSKDIYINNETNNWRSVSFTLPDLKIGSVIEYRYTLTSPYFNKLNDWYFQSDIPKIKSEYESTILSNYKYNVSLKGYFKLNKNNPSVARRCVSIPGLSEGSCHVLSLGMNDIPAFKEEGYMTSIKNYISRVTFELESYTSADGTVEKYTDSWKSTDRKFKSGEYFGSELRKSNFFKRNLPENLTNVADKLEKAKKLFYFIQDHYTYNNNGFTYRKIDTKKSFNERVGNIADINISLYNALKSAGLNSYVALLSTRSIGLPTKVYPVISDFNYIVVLLKIDGKEFFLDATDKNLPFGLIRASALNGYARVLDFSNGSYWKNIEKFNTSNEKIDLNVVVSEDGETKGLLRVVNSGYNAVSLKSELNTIKEGAYLEEYENKNRIEINKYSVKGLNSDSKNVTQVFNFNYETTDAKVGNNFYLNPFFHEAIKINPFKLKKRLYPVNFTYTRNYSYRASIKINENFTVGRLPENKAFALPNNGGKFVFNIKNTNNKITIFFKFQLNRIEYTNEEYFALKEFFNQLVKVQSTLISLKKN
ncbi:MAG: DUF3857 domain-containing protein [Flavobacteriaceae bacterium]|nr:DUF3857 domain-containing protein [Flavobacteriaceae bacterium]